MKKLVLITLVIALSLNCSKKESSPQDTITLQTADSTQTAATIENKDIKATFIELGSVNCIPCRMMQPIMKEIEKEYKDQVKVVFYDVWTPEGQPYGVKYRIRVIPTQVFLDKDDKEYFRHEGYFPKDELVKILQKKGVK